MIEAMDAHVTETTEHFFNLWILVDSLASKTAAVFPDISKQLETQLSSDFFNLCLFRRSLSLLPSSTASSSSSSATLSSTSTAAHPSLPLEQFLLHLEDLLNLSSSPGLLVVLLKSLFQVPVSLEDSHQQETIKFSNFCNLLLRAAEINDMGAVKLAMIEIMELVIETADKPSLNLLCTVLPTAPSQRHLVGPKMTCITAIDRILKLIYFGQPTPDNPQSIQRDLDPYFFDALERKNKQPSSVVEFVLVENENDETNHQFAGLFQTMLSKLIESMMSNGKENTLGGGGGGGEREEGEDAQDDNHEDAKERFWRKQRSMNLKISGLIGNLAWKIQGMDGFDWILSCLESLSRRIVDEFGGVGVDQILAELERYKTYTASLATTRYTTEASTTTAIELNDPALGEFIRKGFEISPTVNLTLDRLELILLLGEIAREIITILLVRGAEVE
ncbi:hypothetical protein BDR26DRAFT_864761 [Obelidium mucronatum]|nr:hypothetical protein BDR26DRAFT_864761 [Obelidium mucronatum]